MGFDESNTQIQQTREIWTHTKALYLGIGIQDFNAIISKRRLTYFHDVIKRPKKDMLY